ncbi:S8 family serine peptidase [Salininema proteolyticum]|uniref:S8 family serine peptidase n=1 Tax=Salininema proteolyticum TaxID=1607685 RepID=A0ABV8TUE0_9ACTN
MSSPASRGSGPRRFRRLLLAALAIAVIVPASVPAQAAPAEEAGIWLVDWSDPSVDPESGLEEIRSRGIEVRRVFDRLWHGVSIEATPTQAHELTESAAFGRAWEDIAVPRPVTGPVEESASARTPELDYATVTTQADVLHGRGITGSGVKVGVIDTGVDYTHPDLGGCFGPGCRVAFGHDFTGDDFNPEEGVDAQPDEDPMDCQGHGTHVAGIVGADGGVTGVAPDAAIGAYRVFGCEGPSSQEIIIAAMEAAAEDGMDVVNMSLGYAYQWPEYPTAVAASALVDEGTVVVASAGNAGESGTFSLGAPSVGEGVLSVASTDNPSARMSRAVVGPHGEEVGWSTLGDAPSPEEGDVFDDLALVENLGCEEDDYPDLEGRTAVIERGECTFDAKYELAVDHGASAVLVYNNVPGPFGAGGVEDREVPGAVVTGEAGTYIRDIAELRVGGSIRFTTEEIEVDLPRADQASSFSSYGPAPDLGAKPDLAAPGGGIWSTYLHDEGEYESMSGTSMSSPHIAGGVALLLEGRPGMAPAEVRARLTSTAETVQWEGNRDIPLNESVHRVGAGVVDLARALDTPVLMGPANIHLGDGTGRRTFTVDVTATVHTSLTFGHEVAAATDGEIRDVRFNAVEPAVSFSPRRATLAAGESTTIEVTLDPGADLPEHSLFGGYVTASDGRGEWSVPYSGYQGRFGDLAVLDHEDFPRLVAEDEDGELTEPVDEGRVFAADERLPGLEAYFKYQSRRSEVRIVDAETGDVAAEVVEDFLPRSSGADDPLLFDLDRAVEDLPAGDWRAELRVVAPGGDPESEDDWEEWTSPEFTVAE